MPIGYKQDLPPEGGYAPIHFNRIKPKAFMNSGLFILGNLVLFHFGIQYWKRRRRYCRKLEVERYNSMLAALPLLRSEEDRLFLKQLWKNREIERDLMKHHPEWKVGTIWGEPVYKTLPKDVLPPINILDFYTHKPQFHQNDYNWPDRWN